MFHATGGLPEILYVRTLNRMGITYAGFNDILITVSASVQRCAFFVLAGVSRDEPFATSCSSGLGVTTAIYGSL
jgi:hypothetical protein